MFCGVCGGRESAAARKDICRVRCGTPPSPAATPPLAGEAAGAAATQKGSPARGAGCARRRRLRGALPVGSGNTPQGPAASCPAAHGGSARPRGGRDRPPYIAAENGRQPVNGSQLQRPATGGYAAAGRVRRPGRIFAGSGAAPLRRLRRHLPLQGRLLGWRQHTERLPCKGSLSSSSLLKAASPVKGRRWRRLPYPSTVTSVRRTWPASQASRSRMQGAGRLPAVRSTLP